ncbi:MAG: heme NO-binding domain-containing protein [Bacteroidota bacterium]
MKGIIFTEFLEMVESEFGLQTVDSIIEGAKLSSGGAYTAVGTYEFSEMLQLVSGLSETTDIPINDLLHAFGMYLFNGLVKTHPEIVASYKNPLNLLYSIEDHIHVHVKKLYPDAELPSFRVLERTTQSMTMIYSSSRGLYALAHGLIQKTFEHFQKEVKIDMKLINEQGSEVKFTILQRG